MEANIQNAEKARSQTDLLLLTDPVSLRAKEFIDEFLDAVIKELSTDRPLLIGDPHYEGPHERK